MSQEMKKKHALRENHPGAGQEPQNPLPAVYLGVISCMQAHFGEAEQYFQAAEERMRTSGMDSELQDTIDTYRQIMKEA